MAGEAGRTAGASSPDVMAETAASIRPRISIGAPASCILAENHQRWGSDDEAVAATLGPSTRGGTSPGLADFLARLARLPAAGADQSFAAFVANALPGPDRQTVRTAATASIASYHAADPERLSVQAAALSERVEAALGAERQFRLPDGYDGLVRWLATATGPDTIRLGRVVTELRWRPGRVEVVTRSAGHAGNEDDGDGGGSEAAAVAAGIQAPTAAEDVFVAPQVVVTLPLGVLQAPAGATGAVRFEPALDEKAGPLQALAMGPVAKVILRFREPFWARAWPDDRRAPELRQVDAGTTGNAGVLRLLRAPGETFPTWWTATAARRDGPPLPVLTGWGGGPAAAQLVGRSRQGILDAALATLGRILGPPCRVRPRWSGASAGRLRVP